MSSFECTCALWRGVAAAEGSRCAAHSECCAFGAGLWVVRYDMHRYNMHRYNMVRYNMHRYNMVRYNMVRYNMHRRLHRRATFASVTRRVGSGVPVA